MKHFNNTGHGNLVDNMIYLTDGGLETTLIFHQGIELKHFAAFGLLKSEAGKQELQKYYTPYLDLASKLGLHYIIETPTWRANPDWGYRLGYSIDELKALNREAVKFIRTIVDEHDIDNQKVLFSGNIGPRGDGYKAENCMTIEEAKNYHSLQIQTFALADVDMVTAMTITYSDEAIGIVNAAKMFDIPVVISFTVETDGKLPNGETLKDAINRTDEVTGHYVEHFMINCAHPEHFKHMIGHQDNWRFRIKGIRANASTKSHAELDESETLDIGDKCLLADGYKQLGQLIPNLQVIGGCCGTDPSHLEEISKAVIKA